MNDVIVRRRGDPKRGACRVLMPQRLRCLQNISGDADGDSLGGFPHRIMCKMRIARGGLDAAEPEQPADDWQALAERKYPRGEGVP